MRPNLLNLLFVTLVGLVMACSGSALSAGGTGTIEGLVRDARGRLLSRVQVRLALGGLSATTRTNPEGAYSISGLQPATGYRLRAKSPRYKTGEQTEIAVAADGNTRVDFALIPIRGAGRGAIKGVVRDAAGEPVRGARIDVLDGSTDGHTTTDRHGRFRLKGLAPGDYSLTATSAGLATRVVSGIQVRDGAPADVHVDLAEADEQQPPQFFGRVRDEIGHAIAGASVEIVSGPSAGSATTGDEGGYEIGGLVPGTYSIRASAEGFWGNTWDGVQLPAGHHLRVDFALHRQRDHEFGAVAGHVRDGEGHAITNAAVEVIEGPTRDGTNSSSKGIYHLQELLPGDYVVQARKEGFTPTHREVQVRADETSGLNFVMERKQATHGRLVGRVRDGEGHLIAGSTVDLAGGDTHTSTHTDAKGIYHFEELLPGDYVVEVGKDGFEPGRKEVRIEAGKIAELNFVLTRRATHGGVAGHVRDQKGHSLANATVELVEGPSDGSVHTGDGGGYLLGELLPGDYLVQASKTGFKSRQLTVQVTAGKTSELNFTLEALAEGAMVGHVRDGEGHAISGALVELIKGPHATTNLKGVFEIAHLTVGVYSVRVSKDGYQVATFHKVRIVGGKATTLNATLSRK